MHLHDLLADLAGFDGAGVLEVRVGPDARRGGANRRGRGGEHRARQPLGRPGIAVLLHPRRSHRRPSSCRRRRRGRRGGPAGRGVVAAAGAAGPSRLRPPRARPARGPVPGRAELRDAHARRDRHERQDHDDVSARGDRTRRGRHHRCHRHRRCAHRRRRAAEPAHDAGGDRAPVDARGDARLRRRDRGDGGVVPRARAAPGRCDALHRDVLHEPHARSPRLPRNDRGVLREQGAAVHAGVHAPRRDQRRRPARRRARATSRRARSDRHPLRGR